MSERAARLVLAGLVLALSGAALSVDLAEISEGSFWGDGATYHAMAHSLANDGDLEYEARDLFRVRREFPGGPQGVFLKRASGGLTLEAAEGFPWLRRLNEDERRIYFAKPFTYPLAAAPLVRLFGTRGLLLTNALALGLALVLGYHELRRRSSPGAALALAAALFVGTIAPVYLLWPVPELFYLGVIALGLWLWRNGHPLASAVVLGVATYSKPYNLWLAIPLGVEPLLPGPGRDGLARRLAESARRGLTLLAAAGLLFGLNAAISGEWNYQGGRERKTFYGKFPGELHVVNGLPRLVTFGNSGIWMSTNQLGPRVESRDAAPAPRGSEPARAAAEIRQSLLWNLGYFWVGRFGGALAYFFPFVLGMLLFLLRGPRDTSGWLALLALLVSYVFYVAMIPDNWYGGTGTLGNRYFLNLLPLGLYVVPRGSERLVAGAGWLAAAVLLGPIFVAPMQHSLRPGLHAIGPPFSLLPAELTMLNDLGVFAEPWRKKQPFGDTEGDAAQGRRADPRAYYLYFSDDGTYGREVHEGSAGFWVKGGASAEVIVRALEPVRRLRLEATGGPAGDELVVSTAGGRLGIAVAPEQQNEGWLAAGAPFVYKDTFVYVLRLRSRRGAPHPEGRVLGCFVSITLDVAPRPPAEPPRASVPFLLLEQRVQAAADLQATLGGARLQ